MSQIVNLDTIKIEDKKNLLKFISYNGMVGSAQLKHQMNFYFESYVEELLKELLEENKIFISKEMYYPNDISVFWKNYS